MCFEIRNEYDLKYLLKYVISSCKFVVNGLKYLDGWFVSYSVFYSKKKSCILWCIKIC